MCGRLLVERSQASLTTTRSNARRSPEAVEIAAKTVDEIAAAYRAQGRMPGSWHGALL
jgi:hypothetical protein